MMVRTEIQSAVALITIDKPPYNTIDLAVRQELMAALDALDDTGVERIILTGTGGNFVDAAATNEFRLPLEPPHLAEIAARIERSRIPVIAAINGKATGYGLALALGCRMRIAAPNASFAISDLAFGIVPGAGVTQRLPRLIGIAATLDLLIGERAIGVEEALTMELIDMIAADPVFAASSISTAEVRKCSSIAERSAPIDDQTVLDAARKLAMKKMRGQDAPLIAISLVAQTMNRPLADGLSAEHAAHFDSLGSDQAAALRHIADAESSPIGLGQMGAADITSAVVVGGGTMGAAIAYALAQIDISVALVESDAAGTARARANVARLYAEAVARGKLAQHAADAAMRERHSFQVGYDKLPSAGIAIEAVFENLDVKRQVFAALDASLGQSTILATNTSYLDPDLIAERLSNSNRFLGLHFFSPAHVMKLVEVIRARDTSPETLDRILGLTRRLGKIPILAGICDGFIGNRILTRYRQICDVMLLEGALPGQIDAAMRKFGMAMGPYEVQDLSGLDIAYANRKRLGWATKPGHRYIAIADRIVDETRRLGRKTGAGWYDYSGGKAEPSSLINNIVVDESSRSKVARRPLSDEEIVERATSAMAAEGLAILAEGVAGRPADIDLVFVHGYGFPRWRGGPMHYAERQGLSALLSRIERYADEDPLSWSVPDLLCRAVADNRSLADLMRTE
jgi:3-hydroxyacyl-CoA dehydrogenase